ncbi:MAG: hypothetical protein NUV91_06475 [Candidatus Omnitrophica bacterium]|nr:hypothetical protein [Candidatus Omnitrophota bacterium]
MVIPENSSDNKILEGKAFAILSYLSILCIIPLILKKDNPFVLFHSKQGLVIFVAEVGVFILHIVFGVWLLKLGMFLLLSLSFVGMIAVLQGQHLEFPGISGIAEKITL